MRRISLAIVFFLAMVVLAYPVYPQDAQLKTAAEVLDRYKVVLGGREAIARVQSQTVRGQVESSDKPGKSNFVYYAKPFKFLFRITRPDGTEVSGGFDGTVSWSVTPQGATVDRETAVEAVRRDADLQYPLHQPDYFQKLEFAGVTDFEGSRCYWLHGTTHWGKDNNQFYDVKTGLLDGYRFQSDDSAAVPVVALFQDYKNFGGPLVSTKRITRSGNHSQTFTFESISYEPLDDSIFDLPQTVKALIK